MATSLLTASLVSLLAAGDVHTSPRAKMGSATPTYLHRQAIAYILKQYPRGISPVLVLGQKSCRFTAGAFWGLWIAGFAKYSPDLWGQLRQVSAFLRVTRRAFSPPEGCMQRKCLRRQRRAWLVADQLLGNSVGAIESVTHAVMTFGCNRVVTLGRFGVSLLGKLAPFGGSALGFGSLA